MHRSLAVGMLVLGLGLSACGSDREPLAFPSEPQGRLLTPTPSAAPAPNITTFSPDGCPASEPRMCQEAAAVADALVQTNMDAIFTLSRPTDIACADVDAEIYQQCEGHASRALEGYVVAAAEPATFVAPEANYRRTLRFMEEGLDPTYSDDLGTGEYRIVGLATCEPGVRYQLVYLVGLGDPTSTLPADRFLGAFELTEQDRGWAISRSALDILSDWQLVFDDPLTDAGCGTIEAWRS